MYTDLYDIYLEWEKKETPDQILDRIRSHFASCGEAYRTGLLTDEEFWASTYYERQVYGKLWEMKDVRVDTASLSRNRDLAESLEEWKRDGSVRIKPWMKRCIASSRDMEEAVHWFFTVLDACKVPLCEFDVIPAQDVKVFPQTALVWNIGGDDRTVRTMMFLTCYDYGKLLHHPSPEGETFRLRLEGGLSMEFTVKEIILEKGQARRYTGTGTITDYVAEPGPLEVRVDAKGFMSITIRRFDLSPWKRIIMTEPGIIPHPRWADFEAARLTRALRIEAEYKILRLPYMLGIADPPVTAPSAGGESRPAAERDGKIIYLFGKKEE